MITKISYNVDRPHCIVANMLDYDIVVHTMCRFCWVMQNTNIGFFLYLWNKVCVYVSVSKSISTTFFPFEKAQTKISKNSFNRKLVFQEEWWYRIIAFQFHQMYLICVYDYHNTLINKHFNLKESIFKRTITVPQSRKIYSINLDF